MAQHAASDLPTFYGETTRDGRVVQRSTEDTAEEILTPPSQACRSCHQHQHSQQLHSLVPFERPCEGPRNKARFDESEVNDTYQRRDRGPGHRDSDIDWDERARRRAFRNKHRRPTDYPRSQRSQEEDSDSEYENYHRNHRGKMSSDNRRHDLHRSYQGRPRPEHGSDGYDGKDDEKEVTKSSADAPMRLPWTMWMNSSLKNHFVATIGEFIGTTMFLFFAFAGTQVANIKSRDSANSTSGGATGFNPEVLLYISLSFGFSLMVNVWCYYRISGGLFNPAVTLAMVLVRSIPLPRAALLVGAQIAGSIFASFLVRVLFPTPFNVRTTLSPGTSLVQGVFIEAILTAELVFTIFMLAKEKHKATFIAPVGIGLALFIAELVGVYYTGGSLNPARSLGPCVITGIFDQEHWIYWVGPATGAILAVVFYKFIKTLEYEMANPGQDGDATEAPTKHPDHEIKQDHEHGVTS